MKIKVAAFLLALIFLSAVPAFADGIIPTGGRPANQTTVEMPVKDDQNAGTEKIFSIWIFLSYFGF